MPVSKIPGAGISGGSVTVNQSAPDNSLVIDSSGNVGIGTTTPNSGVGFAKVTELYGATNCSYAINAAGLYRADFAISSSGGWLGTYTATDMRFVSNNTERMRITSSGAVCVATTDNSKTAGTGIKIQVAGTAGQVSCVGADSTNSNESYHLYSTGAGAYRFYVNYAGTVFATTTTISAISDQRLKENIQDIDVGLNKIMALKPRKFDWKEGKGKNKKGDRGWIAQEFEQVFPEMIDTWLDPAPEGEEPYKAVNADLIPVLVKAIQEQQAMIEELKARIETLEAK